MNLNHFILATAAGGDFWSKMETGLTQFFQYGLGGPGARAFGIVILVVGFIASGISFAVHKFNQQSRMPGWITCLLIGVFGAILMGGVSGPMQLFEMARDTLYSWLGITSST